MESNVRMLMRIVQTQWWMPFMLLTMLVVGCSTEGNVSNVDESKSTGAESTKVSESIKEIETDTKEQEAGQLELIEWDFEIGEYGTTYVVGIVENNTASDFSWVTITFGTYDAEGFKIGEATDSEALNAGEKWKFKAMIFEDNAVNVKALSLDGF